VSAADWQARIDGALAAHFKQPDGSSRPGLDYQLSLQRGEAIHRIVVRAYLAKDLTPATLGDAEYQAQTVLGYIFDRLGQGWVPDGDSNPLPAVTILNPAPGYVHAAPRKRGWLARLLGG
jgi:hypothetical protein